MSSGEKLDRTAKKDLEQQLHVSLASQDYEQAWLALERLVQSSGIAKYYKIGVEILKATRPARVPEFLERAYVSCSAQAEKRDIFVAWMESLLEQGNYRKVIKEIELRMHMERYYSSANVQQLLCTACYDQYMAEPTEKHLEDAITLYSKVYRVISDDSDLFYKFFRLLQISGDNKQLQLLARREFEAIVHDPDVEKAKVILPYLNLSIIEPSHRVQVLIDLHVEDPTQEVDKVDAPLLDALREQYRNEENEVTRAHLMGIQVNILIDRLEEGGIDNWIITEFENCINMMQEDRHNTYTIHALFRIIYGRNVKEVISNVDTTHLEEAYIHRFQMIKNFVYAVQGSAI